MTALPDRCSDTARERADPMIGTAAPARRWLLVEHPGPWPVDALASPGIAPVRLRLQDATAEGSGRVLLVRRPGRRRAGAPLVWLVLDHDAGCLATGTWQGPSSSENVSDAGLLAAADVLAGATPAVPPVEAAVAPQLLVCAHGRHDVCCAVRGRPVAAALAGSWPGDVWECSHVGGDRFAANVVVVPDGVYYGGLDAVSAVEVVAGHLEGRIDPRYLRGFTTEVPAAQAALAEAHRRWGPLDAQAFTTTSVSQTADARWRVELAGAAGLPQRVVVEVARSLRPAARLTCRAVREASAAAFDVTELHVVRS